MKVSESCKYKFHVGVLSSTSSPGHEKNVHAKSELWSASFRRVEVEYTKLLDFFHLARSCSSFFIVF